MVRAGEDADGPRALIQRAGTIWNRRLPSILSPILSGQDGTDFRAGVFRSMGVVAFDGARELHRRGAQSPLALLQLVLEGDRGMPTVDFGPLHRKHDNAGTEEESIPRGGPATLNDGAIRPRSTAGEAPAVPGGQDTEMDGRTAERTRAPLSRGSGRAAGRGAGGEGRSISGYNPRVRSEYDFRSLPVVARGPGRKKPPASTSPARASCETPCRAAPSAPRPAGRSSSSRRRPTCGSDLPDRPAARDGRETKSPSC